MSQGDAEMDRIIRSVQSLAGAPVAVAALAAPLVQTAVQTTAAAGTSPDGTPWKPRKDDGRRALANAAEAVQCRAIGPVVQLSLGSTSTGSAKVQAIQNAQRPILPDRGAALPSTIVQALGLAAHRFFARATGAK